RRFGNRDRGVAVAPSSNDRARIRPPAARGHHTRPGPSETDRVRAHTTSPNPGHGGSGACHRGEVRLITLQQFRDKKLRGERVTALTAYDYPTARLLDESGIDIILVGDSLGMVVIGYEDTTQVTLAEMVHHTKAVARGVKRALLVADFPIHTYVDPADAVATAHELVDADSQAVILEGGCSHVPH